MVTTRRRDSGEVDPNVLRYRRLFHSGIGLVVVGLVATTAYGFAADGSAEVAAFGVLIALAALTFGLLLGFIFGVPRAAPDNDIEKPTGYTANTNLEQISDWLTKIIVGVGLVEFGAIVTQYGKLNGQLAAGLGGHPASAAAAGALIAFFSVVGFLLGHIGTRTALTATLQYFNQLAVGAVASPLLAVKSSLTGLRSSLSALLRDIDAPDIAAEEITQEHNREPVISMPDLDIERVTDIVDLQTHIEGLLGDLIFPLSPRNRPTADMLEILVRRGVLDQQAADALADLLNAADKVSMGAKPSAEDTAAVQNSGLVVLKLLAALRKVASAAFEAHVLDLLRRRTSATPSITVTLDASVTSGTSDFRVHIGDADERPAPKVDAVVERVGRELFVEVRPRVRSGDFHHLFPLRNWLYSLPRGSRVLLVLLGDGLSQRELSSVTDIVEEVELHVLLWDTEADELWTRILRLLRYRG